MGKWESWNIRGHTLEYDDESHTYLCDGLIVPSVTEMIRMQIGCKYNEVPGDVLAEAARKGTLLHKIIEKAEKSSSAETYELSPEEAEMEVEFASYLTLKKENNLTCEGNEMPLLIPYKGKVIAAGRMDMLVMNGEGDLGVVDIKRTYKIDDEYLTYQLTLYGRGLEYSYNIYPSFFACLWLRESKRKLFYYDPCEELTDELFEEFLMRESEIIKK